MERGINAKCIGIEGQERLTAMDAEDAVVDDDGECEEVEHVREVRPNMRGAVLADAFCVEAVCL